MEGKNFVELTGKVVYPELKIVGNGYNLFKAKIAIPVGTEDQKKFQYVKVAGWNTVAEALGELKENAYVKIHGHIEERSYEGKCKGCGAVEKKYWTEVVIDNFIEVSE